MGINPPNQPGNTSAIAMLLSTEAKGNKVRFPDCLVNKKEKAIERALKKVLLTKDSQINTNEGCSRFFDILHFFLFSSR